MIAHNSSTNASVARGECYISAVVCSTRTTVALTLLLSACGRLGYSSGDLALGGEDSGMRFPFFDAAGLRDAGQDAGSTDPGGFDAGVLDAGTFDAGGLDAGGFDAGGMAGQDAGTGIDAGMDAGVDAGPEDAGVDSGPPPFEPCPADALLCEDFESGLGIFSARNHGDGDTVSVVSSPVRTGRRALRLTTGSSGNGFVVAETAIDPALASGTVYGRSMVWVGASTNVQEFMVLIELDDGADTGFQKVSIDLRPDDGLDFVMTTAEPDVGFASPPDTITRERWTCLTFQIDLGSSRSAVFRRDGEVLVTFPPVTTVPPGGHTRMLLAMTSPATGVVGEILYDTVALSRSPLPCPY